MQNYKSPVLYLLDGTIGDDRSTLFSLHNVSSRLHSLYIGADIAFTSDLFLSRQRRKYAFYRILRWKRARMFNLQEPILTDCWGYFIAELKKMVMRRNRYRKIFTAPVILKLKIRNENPTLLSRKIRSWFKARVSDFKWKLGGTLYHGKLFLCFYFLSSQFHS